MDVANRMPVCTASSLEFRLRLTPEEVQSSRIQTLANSPFKRPRDTLGAPSSCESTSSSASSVRGRHRCPKHRRHGSSTSASTSSSAGTPPSATAAGMVAPAPQLVMPMGSLLSSLNEETTPTTVVRIYGTGNDPNSSTNGADDGKGSSTYVSNVARASHDRTPQVPPHGAFSIPHASTATAPLAGQSVVPRRKTDAAPRRPEHRTLEPRDGHNRSSNGIHRSQPVRLKPPHHSDTNGPTKLERVQNQLRHAQHPPAISNHPFTNAPGPSSSIVPTHRGSDPMQPDHPRTHVVGHHRSSSQTPPIRHEPTPRYSKEEHHHVGGDHSRHFSQTSEQWHSRPQTRTRRDHTHTTRSASQTPTQHNKHPDARSLHHAAYGSSHRYGRGGEVVSSKHHPMSSGDRSPAHVSGRTSSSQASTGRRGHSLDATLRHHDGHHQGHDVVSTSHSHKHSFWDHLQQMWHEHHQAMTAGTHHHYPQQHHLVHHTLHAH